MRENNLTISNCSDLSRKCTVISLIAFWVSDYIFDDELVLLAEDGGHFDSDKPIAYRVSGRCWVNNHAHILKAKDNILIDYLYLSRK